MSTPQPHTEQPGEKLPKKRNPAERLVVWGGILALLAVLGYEYMTKNQYESSVKALETAIQAKDDDLTRAGIPSDDIPKYLQGSPKRSEGLASEVMVATGETDKPQKRIIYEWPSLFKSYKVGITVDQTGKAYFVEAIIGSEAQDQDDKPKIKPRANAGAAAQKTTTTSQESKPTGSPAETTSDQTATKPDSPTEKKAEQPDASGKEN